MNNAAVIETASEIGSQIVTYCCQVTSVEPLGANTFQIELQSPVGTALEYQAGQYLQLDLDVNNDNQLRSLLYSIANSFDSEQPRHLQLFIQNSSEFANKILEHLADLSRRNTGAKVTLPMGRAFLQSPLDAPHLLIASGSGISKIKCITQEIVKQHPQAEVNIYWSNKNVGDFYLLDDFQDWVNTYKNLKFTPILESAEANWFGRSGYIYETVEKDFEYLDSAYMYLCGSPQMVYGTIDRLKVIGLREENCYSDVFEFSPRNRKN